MNEDQREVWRKALAAKAADGRRQRYRPRKAQLNVRAGMMRLPAPPPRAEDSGHDHPRTPQ